nr:ester cyclase [Kibdelosporangium sp. MJ126-NF4]CEL17427.1 hypothetical protein [Kibdelosporangium sp. MJ126-NF4]CTQ91346.1 hypothetical protein [Kibdelosporangium sp. MJ126-NF4]
MLDYDFTDQKKLVTQVLLRCLWNTDDLAALDQLDELARPDAVFNVGNRPAVRTVEDFKATVRAAKQGQPDLVYTVEDIIEEGDLVAARLSNVGTNTGDLVGLFPATGRVLRLTALLIVQLDQDGRIVEVWQEGDFLDMLRQAGVVAPAGAGPVTQLRFAVRNAARALVARAR